MEKNDVKFDRFRVDLLFDTRRMHERSISIFWDIDLCKSANADK